MAFRADARRGARSSDNVAALECANDVEVGVYLSSARGAEAGWHYDANHNVTIQARSGYTGPHTTAFAW
jgi:hypothetical protein